MVGLPATTSLGALAFLALSMPAASLPQPRDMLNIAAVEHTRLPRNIVPQIYNLPQGHRSGRHDPPNPDPHRIWLNVSDPWMTDYYSPIKVGGKGFHVVISTGSDTLVVNKGMLDQSDPVKVVGNYSSLYTGRYDMFVDQGSVCEGEVEIGGYKAENQKFVAEGMVTLRKDGILGLNLNSSQSFMVPTSKGWLKNAGSQFHEKVISIVMRSNSTGGYIEFGSIPKEAYRGDLTEVKVIQKPEGDKLSQNYDSWRVYTPQYKVGNGSLKDAHAGSGKNTGTTPCKYASLDTGVTALRLNKAIVDDYHKGLPDAKYSEAFEAHVVPCNTTLPDLGLALDVNGKNDSKVFTVPGNKLKMAMQPLPEYWETKTRYERDAIMEADRKNGIQYNKTGEFCLTGLQYINEEAPKGMCTQMWGAPFFTSVFTVLDFGKKTVKLGEYA